MDTTISPPQALSSIDNNDAYYKLVKEYTIPKVSVDGEPHELLTMIVGISGVIAGVIVLIIIIITVRCGRTESPVEQQPPVPVRASTSRESREDSTDNTNNQPEITVVTIENSELNMPSTSSSMPSMQHHQQQGYSNPVCEDEGESSSSSLSKSKDEIILKVISLPGIKTCQL